MKQLDKVLPRKLWEATTIHENNEHMVEIQESEVILLSEYAKRNNEARYVRASLYKMLKKVSERLPSEYKLVIIEGYRSVQSQQEAWDRMWSKIQTAWPDLTDEEIERKVRLYVAKPSLLANHNCGGAIDLTLAHTDGVVIDMGTLHPSQEDRAEAIDKFPMFSKEITDEQARNRTILRDAMVAAGFVWYPGEWWHYCWGDRMWAVYTEQKDCVYGPINSLV